jgi:chaperonin GroES
MADLTGKKVLPTKILVREAENKKKTTAGGLIIPDTAEDKISSKGTVILCGEGTQSIPMSVKCGDNVMFSPHAGQRIRYDDETFVLLGVYDVLLFW